MPEDKKERKELLENYSVIMKKVKEVLEDKESLEDILTKFPKELETSAAQAIAGRMQRIDAVLEKAGFITEEEKMQYQEALEYSPSGCQIVMARDIDEIWVNSYNPEITEAFDANTDFQICLDFFAIITYISDYFTKDDSSTLKSVINVMKISDW